MSYKHYFLDFHFHTLHTSVWCAKNHVQGRGVAVSRVATHSKDIHFPPSPHSLCTCAHQSAIIVFPAVAVKNDAKSNINMPKSAVGRRFRPGTARITWPEVRLFPTRTQHKHRQPHPPSSTPPLGEGVDLGSHHHPPTRWLLPPPPPRKIDGGKKAHPF